MAIGVSGRTQVAAHLDNAQIIAAAREANVGAMHAGYGFLSENAEFARAVVESVFAFVGPTPEIIQLMSDKIRDRNFVQRDGFPVVPSAIEEDDPATFILRARSIRTPLLDVKIYEATSAIAERLDTPRSSFLIFLQNLLLQCHRKLLHRLNMYSVIRQVHIND